MKDTRETAKEMASILSLCSSMVGVKLVWQNESVRAGIEFLSGHRYCQALMKARHGKHVLLDAEGIACPAAAAAFGFKPLPNGLRTGKGLAGFGIVNKEAIGRAMFEGMTTIPQGKLKALYLFPLETATTEPDIVVVEDETEKLMWIALAYLNIKGGHRVDSNTAILQAACVDATLIPFKEQRLNMSMGCYGCRDATDIGPNETVLGFPFKYFAAIGKTVVFLNKKAIPKSRSKNALVMLKKKEAE